MRINVGTNYYHLWIFSEYVCGPAPRACSRTDNCSRRMFAQRSALILLQLQLVVPEKARAHAYARQTRLDGAKGGVAGSARTAPPVVHSYGCSNGIKGVFSSISSTETLSSVFVRGKPATPTYLLITPPYTVQKAEYSSSDAVLNLSHHSCCAMVCAGTSSGAWNRYRGLTATTGAAAAASSH